MSQTETDGGENLMHVRSRWDYVRKKLRRRGVVEVNKSHPHHDMLLAIQIGIQQLFTEHPESNAKEELLTEDFNHKIKIQVTTPSGHKIGLFLYDRVENIVGKRSHYSVQAVASFATMFEKVVCFRCEEMQYYEWYEFASYASPVFGCIRSAVDIDNEDFLNSLSPKNLDLPYLEFISNSRSGQDFYFSNNQRFILKTDLEHCVQYFLSILGEYLNHFQTYPHSLLVKFLGLYSIKAARSRKKYFLVMQSIFYPTVRLEERFDIKGCLANRYQDPNPPGKKTILVLKDQNFLDEKLELGNEKKWFLTQLRADVDFLISIGVQDYSLLLGRHPIHAFEKKESVGNLVLRMRKSFGHDNSRKPLVEDDEDKSEESKSLPEKISESQLDKEDANTMELQPRNHAENTHDSSLKKSSRKKGSVSPLKKRNVTFLRSLSDQAYLESTGLQFQNKRLLLNCENSLHIIDGEKFRYYVGVIDFFTQFGCHQHVAKVCKDLKTCCGNHSTVPPAMYAERFYEFIAERIV